MMVMGSLYRVLGLADTATAEQIEFGYRSALDKLKSEDLSKEQSLIRLKVLQEAFSILGTQSRREAILAQRAQSEADRAEAQAEAERARLESRRSEAQTRSDSIRESEQRQARYEGQRIHANMDMYNSHQQRVEVTQAQEKERQERQVRIEQLREEQLARARVQNQNAAMQRALSIPILRHLPLGAKKE
jgi:curved DNA-binding protein CbpA